MIQTDVVLSGVSVSFSERTVLRGIDARFPAGKISVMVGRSGSGKTTLLRTVNRLNEEFPGCVTTGSVTLDLGDGPSDIYAPDGLGEHPLSRPELRSRVGMLFQTPNLFPVSVFQNIAMPLRLVAGLPENAIPEAVETALVSVGLWNELQGRLHKPAEHLSGGQQQRLCLARLLALRPAVLLLDEPTASLDVHAARDIEDLLKALAPRYTVIMVSHSLNQARRMADQVLVCENGQITHTGAGGEALSEDVLAGLL